MYDYKIFESLCKEKGVTAYRVAKETGLTTATLSNWKNGRYTPKSDKMKAIADFFGVTLEYLSTGKNPEPKQGYYLNEETAKIAQENFQNSEIHLLMDALRDVEPEDLLAIRELVLRLKKKERGE